jgi:hypothetical protein
MGNVVKDAITNPLGFVNDTFIQPSIDLGNELFVKPVQKAGESIGDMFTPDINIPEPPDLDAERAAAEEAAKKIAGDRRRRRLAAGRQSTVHALGSTTEASKTTLGA